MADPVALAGAVTGKLTNLVVTRDGNKITAEWKIPAYLKDPSYSRRLTSVDAYIDFVCNPNSNTQQVEVWKNIFGDNSRKPLSTTLGYDHYFVRGLERDGMWTTSDGTSAGEDFEKPYDRNRYYPVTSKKCTGVNVGVHGVNAYGSHDDVYNRGPNVWQTFEIKAPQQPVCEFTGWDEDDNYAAAYTIDANPGDEDESKTHFERYDTRYRIMRQDNLPNSEFAQRKPLMDFVESSLEKVENSIAAPPELRSLQDGQWIRLDLEAYSRGMAGQSIHSSASILAARPERAAITSVKASSLDAVYGVVTVSVSIPWDGYHWTTQAKLQRAKNVDPSWSAQKVAADGTWEDVSGMLQIDEVYGDATYTTGFCDSVASAYPNENRRTWYRVITENDLYYGDNASSGIPAEASVLYHEATASDDSVFIESMTTNDGADSIKVLLGWPDDDSTGTEVSWSEHPDAWESSEQPSTAQVTWEDATSQGAHANSASFTIYGTEAGKPCYVKARRYLVDANDETSYGPYATGSASMFPYTPAQPPTDVRLSAPSYVTRGGDVPLTWTFQSDAPQTAWVVYLVEYTVSGNVRTESSRQAILSGEDAYGSCTIPASKLSGDSACLAVSVTTGSEWAASQVAEVVFADPPELSVTYPTAEDPDYETTYPLLLEQPMTLYCESDTGDDLLHVRVLSNGVSYGLPDRDEAQAVGEPVFDAWVRPAWGVDSGSYYCAVTLPTDVPFVDVGVYTWEVTSQNETTSMLSETQTGLVKVRWAHQAHQPREGSTAVPNVATRSVAVTPAGPDNLAPADVFDLYRVTPDGADLIAEGMRYGTTVVDRHAPFGDGSYRVATRTVDGDVAWADIGYSLPCRSMRFDWEGDSVELPYNVVRQDSWSKDFEERAHLDGERAGFWNAGASRSASLSTDMFRFDSKADQELVRNLATHAGPVFVRLPNGCAYQANVDVGGMDESYQSGAISVSFSATQVALTDAFRVALADIDASGVEEYEPASYDRSQVLSWSDAAPSSGDSFALASAPSGNVLVELTASHDYYSDTWTVANTVSGTTVTLGAFTADLQAFISEASAEDAKFRLMARYDVEG